MQIQINTITLTEAPEGFDATGTLMNTFVSEDGRVVLAYDLNSRKSSIAVQGEDGRWADSLNTQDWPVLDRQLGGRETWREAVADHQADTEADLEDEE